MNVSVRVNGHEVGTAKRTSANEIHLHDEGTAGAGPGASANTRGDRERVFITWCLNGPVVVTVTWSEGTS
jgi:hypothetical protein